MNIVVIGVMIVVALIVGISINGYIQRREQLAAERRHRVAQHRAGMRDGQELMELGNELPLDNSVRSVLLDYIQLHLQSMRSIDSQAEGLAEQEQWLNTQRQLLQSKVTDATAHLTLPSESAELTALRTRLHRLTEFVARLRQDKRLNASHIIVAFKSLARLRLRCDVEGHIKLGQLAVMNHQPNLAKQYYKYASDRLVQENISDSYVQEQLATLDQLMAELRGEAPPEAATAASTEPQESELEKAAKKEMAADFVPKKKW
jgi:hypothetical protein